MKMESHHSFTQLPIHPLIFNRVQNKLRLKHFALLRCLGDAQNLHLAAQELNITQPAATKLLKDMEETLDLRLFERHARGVRPTAIGASVVEYARSLMGQLGHFTHDVENKRSGGHGFLSLGAIMGSVPDIVAPAIKEMKQRYPLMTVRVLGDTSDQIMQLLEAHQIEFGVCRYIAAQQSEQFQFEALGNEHLLFVASPGHPWAQRRKITLPDLLDEMWVMQPLPSPSRVLLEEAFALHSMPRPPRMIECGSMFAALQMLKQTRAVALLSRAVVKESLSTRQITRLRLVQDRQLKEFGLVTRRGAAMSSAAQELADVIRKHAQRIGIAQR